MSEVPIRDAATVMLVRDAEGGAGIEVFMVRRTPSAAFAGGAYVFPGGAVDGADGHADLDSYCDGRTDAEASALLAVDRGGLAFWVAAVRESFEEAGVLLAADAAVGTPLRLDDPEVQARFGGHRRAVHDGDRRLVEICAEEGLRLTVGDIHYFSHWITPAGQPRRFDTRFFVAAAPAGQEPLHDDGETVASCWVRPADALARHRAGELDLILPTIHNLEAIDRFDSVGALLAAAAAIADVPVMETRVVADGGGFRILLPGDAGYDDAVVPDRTLVPGMPLPGRPGGPNIQGLVR